MHRFFLLDQPLIVNQSVALDSICHQLSNVLRLQPGTQVGLLDNQGFLYTTEIVELGRKRGMGKVLDKTLVSAEPKTYLTLYQCSLKHDKFEWVLQKGTELGVSQFVPVISERSVVRPASAIERKVDRWSKIIQEAAEQCGRGRIPLLAPPLLIEDALTSAVGVKLMPWEETSKEGKQNSLRSALPQGGGTSPSQLSLLIGPEGGFTEAEAAAAQNEQWAIVSLGRRILRAETAAVAASAILMNLLD